MTFSLSSAEEALRRRMYDEGLSDREAAGILGINPVSFLLWRHRRGLPAKRHGAPPKPKPAPKRQWPIRRTDNSPFCQCGNLIVPGKTHRHARVDT